MTVEKVNAPDGPPAFAGYSNAVVVSGAGRTLYLSGQVGAGPDGMVPDGIEAQSRLAWANVGKQLAAAGMTLDNIVKVTTYIANAADRTVYRRVRAEVLGDRAPAMTSVVATLFEPDWLVEIEVIAVD
jgi:enamine deaminase RidA (YjgF/YER057c/UK114 family)